MAGFESALKGLSIHNFRHLPFSQLENQKSPEGLAGDLVPICCSLGWDLFEKHP